VLYGLKQPSRTCLKIFLLWSLSLDLFIVLMILLFLLNALM
jgi:hypothetical protein